MVTTRLLRRRARADASRSRSVSSCVRCSIRVRCLSSISSLPLRRWHSIAHSTSAGSVDDIVRSHSPRRQPSSPLAPRPTVLRRSVGDCAADGGRSCPRRRLVLTGANRCATIRLCRETHSPFIRLNNGDVPRGRDYLSVSGSVTSMGGYMGTAPHCPRCGREVPPDSAVCPACGLELHEERPRLATGMLPSNQLIHRRYVIARRLAQGGQSAVYLVGDMVEGGQRALKEMSDANLSPVDRESAINDFIREAHMLSTLDHPALARLYQN